MTFSGVASNFAGVPLALAFIFTIGRTGFVTVFLKTVLGVDVYGNGFTIYSKLGLEIVYLYFQLPLMVLIIAPAIDGLKKDWREASESAGASTFQYWRHVAFPILLPSLLASAILLFGNSFGAQATAFALTGGFLQLVTILIGNQLAGDVLGSKNLAFAVAMGMVAIMGVTLIAYTWLRPPSGALAAMTGQQDALHFELDELTRPHPVPPRRQRAAGKLIGSWVVLLLSLAYFFLPLIGTLLFSLRAKPFGQAYADMIEGPAVWKSLGYSFTRRASSRSSSAPSCSSRRRSGSAFGCLACGHTSRRSPSCRS